MPTNAAVMASWDQGWRAAIQSSLLAGLRRRRWPLTIAGGQDVVLTAIWDDIWDILTQIYDFFKDNAHRLWDWMWDHLLHAWWWVNDQGQRVAGWFGQVIEDWFNGTRVWVEDHVRWLLEAAGGALNWVWNRIGDIGTWVRDKVSSIADWLWARIGDIGTWVRDKVSSIADWLWGRIGEVGTWVWSKVNDVGNWLGSHITYWAKWVWDTVGPRLDWLKDRIVEWAKWLWNNISVLDQWLRTWIPTSLFGPDGVVARLGLAIFDRGSDTINFIQEELIDPLGDWLRRFWDDFTSAVTNLGTWVGDRLKDIATWLWSNIGQPLWNTARNAISWIGDVFGTVINQAMNLFWGLLTSFSPVTPEESFPVARDLIVRLGAVVLGLGTMFLAGELLHPLKTMGLGHLSAILFDFTQFKLLTGVVIGALVGSSLKRPLEYHFNNIFRPWIPPEGTLSAMRAKHEIGRAQFAQSMAYLGYTDEWITIYEGYLPRDPRLFEIIRIAEITSPPPTAPPEDERWLRERGLFPSNPADWWYAIKFAKAGYSETDIDVLTLAAKAAIQRREQTRHLDEIRRDYVDATITDQQAINRMLRAGLTPQVANFRLAAYRMERSRAGVSLRTAPYTTRFRKGNSNRDKLQSQYEALGYLPARATLMVQHASALRAPTIKPTPEKLRYQTDVGRIELAAYILLFHHEMILEAEFRARLASLQMPQAMINAIVLREIARLGPPPPPTPAYETDAGRILLSAYRLLFRDEVITESSFRSHLRDLQVPRDLENAIVLEEIARRGPPPAPAVTPRYKTEAGREALAAHRLAFFEGFIDEAGFRRRLGLLEIPGDLANAIVLRERTRRIVVPTLPTPPARYETEAGREVLAAHRQAFFEGFIDEPEFRRRLGALEIPGDLASAIVLREKIRRRAAAQESKGILE